MKILIVRFSSIGDIVLTTPVIRALKTQLTNVQIHFLTKNNFRVVLDDNPYLDQIHTINKSVNEVLPTLQEAQFDWVIDLHHNLRSQILKWRLGKASKSFHKLNWQKWLLVKLKIDRLPNRHIVDRYMDTVAHLGVKSDTLGLDYFIADKDQVENDWLPEAHQNGYVAVAIGGQHTTKKLPTRRLIELCDRINKPIILLGGPEDQAAGEEIALFFKRNDPESHQEIQLREELAKKADVFNGCGKFNLNQSASIIKNAMVVFTHDTGLMHIAAAFGKKIYSIWGNTVPEFGMYPYRTQFVIFENKKINCRPCSKIGFDKCPKGHFKCMEELVFDFYLPD